MKKKHPEGHATDMKRPGMGELGDLDHIEEYKHVMVAPKDKEKPVKVAEHRLKVAANRAKRNKGRY